MITKAFIQSILEKNHLAATDEFKTSIAEMIERKLQSLKTIMSERMSEVEEQNETLDEGNVVRQGRVKLIRVRIRNGKVQKRVKTSAVKGFTLSHGKLKRISFSTHMKMKRVQKRAAMKRHSKLSRSLMKRKRSMRKLRSLGVR